MKEYTVLSVISLLITLLVDRKGTIHLLQRPELYVFLLIILLVKILVNGYLTSQLIVIYNPRFFLNIRLGSIPLEDFLFGFTSARESAAGTPPGGKICCLGMPLRKASSGCAR